MKLYVAPYQLQLKSGWSRNHTGQGCLIKIEDTVGNFGYADLHPWPSLGDQNIEEQINLLKLGQQTSLAARSIELATTDLQARKNKVSLFQLNQSAQYKIENHHLVMSLAKLKENLANNDAEVFNYLAKIQSQIIKVKVGTAINAEVELILAIIDAYPKIIFRLDFNEALSYEGFIAFWQNLPTQAKEKIQYCEDPIPWSALHWQKLHEYGVPLAADRVLDQFIVATEGLLKSFPISDSSIITDPKIFNILSYIDFLVLKPAKYNLKFLQELKSQEIIQFKKHNIKLLVTSYLDHPVGITHAYLEALNLAKTFPEQLTTCGLYSMGAYEDTPFMVEQNIFRGLNSANNTNNINNNSSTINMSGASSVRDVSSASGVNTANNEFGIGFTTLLENQKWTYCSQF